jgi:macrolide transport system ATP-binding/permease protein
MVRVSRSLTESALRARDITKSYGDRVVLGGIDLIASPGQRLGLVGENGVGKSTLLRILAGVEAPDGGLVTRPSDIGYLAQELPAEPGRRMVDVLEAALAEPHELTRRVERLAADPGRLDEYAEALEQAVVRDAWDADRRATLVLDGLGLADLPLDRGLDEISGGERSRLALAALLLCRPRALLLDEPTNHLDDSAVEFLQQHLAELPGVMIVASHDRVLLDAVCTDICDLDPARGGVTRYGGAYGKYLQAKRAERARWEQAYAEHQDKVAAARHAVATTARNVAPGRAIRDKNKMAYGLRGDAVQASVASRVRNAQRRLDVLLADPVRKPPAQLRFTGSLGREASGDAPVLAARDLDVPGRLRLRLLDVPADGRLLVTGPNGAGKSTLLSVLAGALPTAGGWVWRRRGLRVALLEQDVRFADPARTPREVWGERPGANLQELGLLGGRDLDRPLWTLSTGQRRRLAVALLVSEEPHVLLLDEPTNHLSLALVEDLEAALPTAPAAIVVASHDRWLRRHWAGDELQLAAA